MTSQYTSEQYLEIFKTAFVQQPEEELTIKFIELETFIKTNLSKGFYKSLALYMLKLSGNACINSLNIAKSSNLDNISITSQLILK